MSWEYQGLVQCLGTGHIRHLVAYNCQETQRERESETDWWPGEITSVSHDLCQLSQKDEMPKGKNVNSAKQPITDGASVSSGIQMHCNKGAGPLPPTCTRNSRCGGEQCPPGEIIRQWFFPLKGPTVGCLKSIHALSTGSFQEKIKCLLITKIFKYGSVQKSWATPDSLSFYYDIGCFFSHFQSIFTGTLWFPC